jgi:hypothetical protein
MRLTCGFVAPNDAGELTTVIPGRGGAATPHPPGPPPPPAPE